MSGFKKKEEKSKTLEHKHLNFFLPHHPCRRVICEEEKDKINPVATCVEPTIIYETAHLPTKWGFMPVDKVNQSLITQEGDHSLTIKGRKCAVCNACSANK